MHKQLQKFGHFVLKNLNDEPNTTNDKYVKYIYKKESGSAEKSHNRKIKSANDADTNSKFSRKYAHEETLRTHRKRSSDSLGKTHRKKESLSNNFSETEIFFISPEEIKKHRRKMLKNREESPERVRGKRTGHQSPNYDNDRERRNAKITEDHFEKYLKQQKQKTNKDYQWLTKKEIFRLINNANEPPKDSSAGSRFFKKFFLFDKDTSQNKAEFIPVSNTYYKKAHRYSEDNSNMIFLPFKASMNDKETPKASKKHEKSSTERLVDLMCVRDSKKKQKSKATDNSVEKSPMDDVDFHTKISKKRKSQTPINDNLVLEDLDIFQKRDIAKAKIMERQEKKQGNPRSADKSSIQTIQKKESRISKLSINKQQERKMISHQEMTKTKSKKMVQDADEENIKLAKAKKEELDKRLQNISRTNPKRHRFCLVKNTFSVVEIPPVQQVDDSSLEKKKKLKAFKKYYKYNRNTDKDSEFTNSTTFHTFSDSHKMYQDTAEQSVEDATKKRHKRSRRIPVQRDLKLRLETHISSVVIKPELHKSVVKPNESSKDDRKIKRSKASVQKSKIPVLSSHGKIVELARDASPVSKSRKKSADLFSPKVTTLEEKEVVPKLEDSKKRKAKVQKDKGGNVVDKESISTSKGNGDKPDNIGCSKRNKVSSLKKEKTVASVKERILPSSKSNSEKSSFVGERSSSVKPTRVQPPPNKIQEVDTSSKTEKKSRPSTIPRADKVSKVSATSSISKQSKVSNVDNKSVKSTTKSASKNPSPLSSSAHPKKSLDKTQRGVKATSKSSYDDASTAYSRVSSKKSAKSSLTSKSDTKLEENKKVHLNEKEKHFDKSSAKTSLSNSTCGDKSVDSSRNGTSFFLTKSYRDDDKLNRWQKRKQYADNLRKNAISKNQKGSVIPPQVLEVRYLTVSKTDDVSVPQEDVLNQEHTNAILPPPEYLEDPQSNSSEILEIEDLQPSNTQFYENDLPQPCFEVVECDRFKELFSLPVEDALNEILNENSNFLKKDFSYPVDIKSSSSDDDLSSDDLRSDTRVHDWYNFKASNPDSLSEISCCGKIFNKVDNQDPILGSQDHIIDSLSAPGSEESGYSTIKSRKVSTSFFEQPQIKALFDPPLKTLDSYCVEVQIETNSSSNCGVEIHSIESKSLQTTIECSQKSVQIRMSQEETEEMTGNCGKREDTKKHEAGVGKGLTLEVGDLKEEKANEVEEKNDEQRNQDKTAVEEEPQADTTNNLKVSDENHIEDRPENVETEVDKNGSEMSGERGAGTMSNSKENEKNKNKSKEKRKNFKEKASFWSCFSCVSSSE